ncbi:two-component system, NarL family, sensor histidine kinase DesK [Lentzea xinjiangensis]|uniref:Two-component system, NarL family, sensor histidine kinase DesK n=1 Tax=Lentzea xinjiangensis TaxID=402600 RepID=A0A1H9RUB0_9PSEU|nr:sensor histidine kinase [Lentzea xinjiangensis]SER75519.1 two-component system, NarL family, sensor histidine kinase DesK [Lentzea xinjiangensis]
MKKVAGASRWFHLLYLGNLLWSVVFDPATDWVDWALVAVVVVAFVPMYVLAWRRPELVRRWCLVPTVVLGALVTPFNTGAAVLFVYAAAFAGLAESRRVAMRWFFGLSALICVFAVVSTVPMPYRLWGLLPSLIFLWLVGVLQVEWSERERDAEELRIRTARVEHLATLAERERIARDLHDLLGHTLTAIVVRAQLVAADPARAREEAAEIERTARAALGEIRDAVTGWRSASLDTELEAARTALTSLGVEVVVRRDPDLVIVGSTEHELALALREAVTNVARHARARTCRIGVEARDGELRLVVADDGVGSRAPEGNGLTGMRERIAALGGLVRRTGSAGTTVTIAVPLRVAT